MPKLYTQSEMEKLPNCKYSDYGKCTHIEEANPKLCLMCLYQLILDELRHEDIAGATHSLITMMHVLKEMDAIPKEAKP
jgi:hypothetical protein